MRGSQAMHTKFQSGLLGRSQVMHTKFPVAPKVYFFRCGNDLLFLDAKLLILEGVKNATIFTAAHVYSHCAGDLSYVLALRAPS